MLQAVKDKVVKIGLIDATVATSYTEDMKRLGLFVTKVINMKSGHGVALSGGLEVIRDDVKSYVMSKMPFINEFVRQKVPLLYVSNISNLVRLICQINELVSQSK